MWRRGSTALMAIVAVLAGAPAQAATGGWTQQGAGPGHTSRARSVGNLTPSSVRSLSLNLTAPTSMQPGFAVDGAVAYATTSAGRLLAVSTDDGRRLWSRATCDSRPQGHSVWAGSAPAVYGDTVWVNSGSVLSGISATTHRPVACVDLGAEYASYLVGSPTVYRGYVYVANGPTVFAVNAATGAVRWTVTVPAGNAAGTVAADGGIILVPTASASDSSGTVYALRAFNGTVAWSHASAVQTSVAAVGGRVFLDDPPTALDEATGAVLWSRPDYLPGAGVSADAKRVYLFCGEASTAPGPDGTCDGRVVALDAATGSLRWVAPVASEGEGVVTVGGGVVYVTDPVDSGHLFLLNAGTGAVIGQREHQNGYYESQPVVVDGSVYLVGSLLNGAGFLDRWGV